MKKWMLGLGMVGLGLLATSEARAENKGTKLIAIAWLGTTDACAVSAEVTESEGGLTDGTEKLKFGTEYSWTFSEGNFPPSGGSWGVGKRVLYGSEAFVTETKGGKVDITIPNAACKAFNLSGGMLSFDGSLARNPNLFNVTVPPNLGIWKGVDGAGTTLDLSANPVTLQSYTGMIITGGSNTSSSSTSSSSSGGMGSSSGGSSGASSSNGSSGTVSPTGGSGDDGGCSRVAPAPASSNGLLAAIPAIGLVIAALRRRRK